MSSGQGLPAWGHFCETRDMAGYPKIWTTLWTSPQFRALKGNARGFLMQLILWCKHERDDGLILAESYSKLGSETGYSRQTVARLLSKLDALGYTESTMLSKMMSKLDGDGAQNAKKRTASVQNDSQIGRRRCAESVQNGQGQLIIRLPMYDESQKLTAKQASSRRRIWPVQVSKLDGEKSTTRPEQTRAEQSKPSDMHAGTEDRSPHARFCLWIDSDIGKDYQAEARSLYPHLSISHEIEKAKVWVRDNPKRGNKKNWRSFMTRWLGRAEESISRKTGQAAVVDSEALAKEFEEWSDKKEHEKIDRQS